MKRNEYYNLKNILAYKADYNIIIGERSNGKTYALLEKALKDYVDGKKDGKIVQSAYIRRWNDDLIGKRAGNIFNAIIDNGLVEKYTKGEYNNIIFSNGAYYLARPLTDDEKKTSKRMVMGDKTPFCYTFALSNVEHDKSTSYPNIQNIIFDEFLTRRLYIPDEFVIFMNCLSTIIRERDNVQIFMLGNTVNKSAPYFSEMGLSNVETQQQGTIDLYTFANKLTVAVEYCSETKKSSKKSNKYFAFDNPKLNMITGGKWEMAIYPHLPVGYSIQKDNIIFSFTVKFGSKLLTGDIVSKDMDYFLFVHKKTTPYKDGLIYGDTSIVDVYHRKDFFHGNNKIDKKIVAFFTTYRVYYESNEVGEIMRNYLLSSTKIYRGDFS